MGTDGDILGRIRGFMLKKVAGMSYTVDNVKYPTHQEVKHEKFI